MKNPDAHGSYTENGKVRARLNGLTRYLHPGQIFVSAEPYLVTTILGSCVAVCLWDPLIEAGGISHYALPYRVGDKQFSPRFGNVAIQLLIEKLIVLGSERQNLRAKLFGGACVIEAFRGREDHLGKQNIDVGRKVLSDERISIIAEDVGGQQARKLTFFVDDGTAWVSRV
ncbi:MAG TPA: chemotaxis protein CheD [Blastocatellia bacterium]|nr:chemotaxis protein CheD [Blastocatellia bacterium]